MNAIERLNVLFQWHGLPPITPESIFGKFHEHLDELDRYSGIDTSGGIRKAPLGRSGVTPINPVGARLALLEERTARFSPLPAPRTGYYHWLGHDACCACGCGEHRRL
jgi:hypothetical protein